MIHDLLRVVLEVLGLLVAVDPSLSGSALTVALLALEIGRASCRERV